MNVSTQIEKENLYLGVECNVVQSGSLQVALERVLFEVVCVKLKVSRDSMKLVMPRTQTTC